MEKLSTTMMHKTHKKGELHFLRENYIYSNENWLPMFKERKSSFFDINKIISTEEDISLK